MIRHGPIRALTALLLSIAGVQGRAAAQGPEEPAQVALSGQGIRFTGRITEAAAADFARLLNSNDGSGVSTLRINSRGGDATAGLKIASLVRDRRLSVVVEQLCGSACAAYILPAAARAVLQPDAFITLHWMPSASMGFIASERVRRLEGRPDSESRADLLLASMNDLVERQQLFYRSIGVDPARMEAIMDVWLELHRQMTRLRKPVNPNQVSFVPDSSFIRNCLGLSNVESRSFDVADSIIHSRPGVSARAFLINGFLYFEGERVSDRDFSCPVGAQRAPT